MYKCENVANCVIYILFLLNVPQYVLLQVKFLALTKCDQIGLAFSTNL